MTIRTYRRLGLAALAVVLTLAAPGCKKKDVRVQTDEEAPRMASTVNMSDQRAEPQLVSGFYGIEEGSWRWTARQFSIVLRAPNGAAQKGATLQARLSVPEPVIQKLQTVSLSANAGGQPMAPETYTRPGEYVFKRDVPASAFGAESVKIDFQLDKAMPPAGQDIRELGIVVLSIGLEPK